MEWEKPRSRENRETLNSMALLLRQHDLNTISPENRTVLRLWRKQATPQDLQEIEKIAGKSISSQYRSRDISQKRIEEIENIMEEDSGLKEYIEEVWIRELVKNFEKWKSSLENIEEFKKDKSRPYEERKKELKIKKVTITKEIEAELQESADDFLNRITPTSREIFKLFEFIEKNPSSIKNAIELVRGSDIILTNTEYNFLKDLKDYFDNTAHLKKEELVKNRINELNNLIIDNPSMRTIFSKIQTYFNQKKS